MSSHATDLVYAKSSSSQPNIRNDQSSLLTATPKHRLSRALF